MHCHFCGQVIPPDLSIYRNTLCPGCGRDLKICLNCSFYQPGAHWDCRESIQDQVRDKDRANFCDFFRPAKDRPAGPGPDSPGAKSRFDKLFGG